MLALPGRFFGLLPLDGSSELSADVVEHLQQLFVGLLELLRKEFEHGDGFLTHPYGKGE